MTEKDYINATALGKITSATAVLRELCKDNLTHIITDGEWSKVTPTLCDWQERLLKAVKSEDTKDFEFVLDDPIGKSDVTYSKDDVLHNSISALKSVVTVCPQFSNFQVIVDEYEELIKNK